MLDQSEANTVYLRGPAEEETMAVETAHYSLYSDEHGEWLLILVHCPDCRSIEIGIPLPAGYALKETDVLTGVAYDEAKGGWLTNMYYYTHFGIEDVVVTVGSVTASATAFSVGGRIADGAPRDLETMAVTVTATRDDRLRKSFV